jgi:thiamine biosynthesis lipoprotein
MSLSRRRFITIAAGSLLAATPGWAATEDGARWRGVALGAEADLRIVGMPRAHAQELISIARAEIERLEKQFSLYRQDSALVSLNENGLLRDPSPDMLELLSLAGFVHAASDGVFDPTIQPLWKVYAENRGEPSGELIESALGKIGWRKVEVSSSVVRLPDGGGLTLNGIAQGFITDKVVALLKSHGLQRALVNVGEISAVGRPSGLDAWPVQLDAPGSARRTIGLRDRAVATSGALGTTLDGDGIVSHILDPRNGQPAPSLWRRVSIQHRSAALADGLSTAGVLMSADELAALQGQFDDVSVDAISREGSSFLL